MTFGKSSNNGVLVASKMSRKVGYLTGELLVKLAVLSRLFSKLDISALSFNKDSCVSQIHRD